MIWLLCSKVSTEKCVSHGVMNLYLVIMTSFPFSQIDFQRKELIKKEKKKCFRGSRLYISSQSRRSTSHGDQQRCCAKWYVINERQRIVWEITDGFAKGAYVVKSFWKAQNCIFLNVLRVFKMYFCDIIMRKKSFNSCMH